MRHVYQSYLNTRRKIPVIEGQFRAYNDLDLLLSLDVFGPHPGPVQAWAELDILRTIIARQNLYVYSPWKNSGFSEHNRELIKPRLTVYRCISIYKFGLSVWVFVCLSVCLCVWLFVSNKHQNS